MFNKFIRKLKTAYSASPAFHRLAKYIAASSPYYYLTRTRIFSQMRKLEGGPFNLVIETSNFCNARCLMCPNLTMKRKKSVMTREVFEKIVARIKEEKLLLNKVFFSGLGEPLTDPDIVPRIKAFKDMKAKVRIYTNASLLTREMSRPSDVSGTSEELVGLGIEEMNISFNGANPMQYSQVMGLDYSKTLKNIKAFLEIKKQMKRRLPAIQISSVIIEKNENDIKNFLAFWQDKVDSVTVSLAHEWGGGVEISSKFKVQSSKFGETTYPCRSLWHTFNILSNGDFSICCRDYEGKYVLGNVMTHSFSQIRQSPILRVFQESNLKFSKQALPAMCQQCNFPYQDGIEWYLPRSID